MKFSLQKIPPPPPMLSTYYGLNKFSKIDKNNCNSVTGAQHYINHHKQQNIESIFYTLQQQNTNTK